MNPGTAGLTNDYDAVADLYDAYVRTDCDVDFFLAEARRQPGPVLELACGTGRLSMPLVQAGVALTCVDCSARMLAVLAAKLAERGLEAELVQADLCRMDLAARFPLAIIPFNAFMEIVGRDRQRSALAAIASALLPGGRFLCTLHNPVIRRRLVDGVLRLVGHYSLGDGSLVVSGCERGEDGLVHRLQVFEGYDVNGVLLWKRMMPMSFALIDPRALQALAAGVGFRLQHAYGGYDRQRYEPVESPVAILEFVKAGTP